MPYGTISNGDSGASVRAQLNTLLANCAVNPPVTPTPGGPNDASILLSYGTTFVLPGANGGDGLQLPAAVAGARVELVRQANAANWVAVFCVSGGADTVNGITDQIDWAPSQDTTLSPSLVFLCGVDGAWNTNGELD